MATCMVPAVDLPRDSGCSTLLRTIAGETNGTLVDEISYVNYQGRVSSRTSSSTAIGEIQQPILMLLPRY